MFGELSYRVINAQHIGKNSKIQKLRNQIAVYTERELADGEVHAPICMPPPLGW